MITFLVLSLVILLVVISTSNLYRKIQKKNLRQQAGTTSVHGVAARSLQSEKMRIRKMNRDKGVIGEIGIAEDLQRLALEYGLTVLHDLSIPGTKANIDHILITRKVVFVIDAKNYTGLVKVGPNRAGSKRLRVNGRDQSPLVAKLKRYAEAVEAYLKSEGVDIKVIPLLAFYQGKFDAKSAVSIDGVLVNVYGIENELLRSANHKAPEFEPSEISAEILRGFPLKG
jgi:hypothetical protein